MKNIEKELNQWRATAIHNGADQIYISVDVVNEILERIKDLKDEIENQTNRADLNFLVASFFEENATQWVEYTQYLEAEIAYLTDEIP